MTIGVPSRDEMAAILKRVKDPETEKILLEPALVSNIDFREDGTLVVDIGFKSRNPSCAPIAWLVQKGITDAPAVCRAFHLKNGILNEQISYRSLRDEIKVQAGG